MIRAYRRRRLTFTTITYWVLLLFIIAAWVWWFISLQRQNDQMRGYKTLQLNKDDVAYAQKSNSIAEEHKRKTAQYISEGITFVFVTLVGAVFVYRSVRRHFLLSRQQQNFMMAVTHELKTPIAVVNLNLETLQKRKLDDEKQQRIINSTLLEAGRLNDLTTNILVTSQLESHYVPDKESINFSELCENCANVFATRHQYKNLNNKIEQQVFLNGEKLLLQLLVNNLLDNALKYASKEKTIAIELSKRNNKAILKVTDEGVGIKDEEKKKIFDKFYRSGNEEIRKTKGTGLGLYLCKRIAENHRAKIRIQNNEPDGSIFIVEFKL